MSMKDFITGATYVEQRQRPRRQKKARALFRALPPYLTQEKPNAAWPSPGKGVSGETSN